MVDHSKKETVVGKNSKGNDVTVIIRPPTQKDKNAAQLQYLKSFRQALDNGAILKQKLEEHLIDQGIWDEAKQEQYDKITETLNGGDRKLKKGGIKLEEAKEIAIQMQEARMDFRLLIAERTAMDSNTAESQADNASFDYLASVCIVNEKGEPVFDGMESYQNSGDEPYVAQAAASLASKLYQLDPDYDKTLPENKFLRQYNFIDEELRTINKSGELVDSEGRLVNENGRYIDAEGSFVDRDGNPVNEEGEPIVEFSPFLDDKGDPVALDLEEEAGVAEDSKPSKDKVSAKKSPVKKKEKVTEPTKAEASKG
jgi:hypothetical protein